MGGSSVTVSVSINYLVYKSALSEIAGPRHTTPSVQKLIISMEKGVAV
jgi:hypothetical protein